VVAWLVVACAEDPGDPCDAPGAICTVAGLPGVAALGAHWGIAAEEPLYFPVDIAFDDDGTPFLLDWNNHRVLRLTAAGQYAVVLSHESVGGESDWMRRPADLLFEPDGSSILVGNLEARRVDLGVDDNGILLCEAGDCAGVDVVGVTAVARHEDGTLFLSDYAGAQILSLLPDGSAVRVAGTGVPGSGGDGGPALDASFFPPGDVWPNQALPGGLLLDGDVLYVADTEAHRIRAVDLRTGTVDTVAGSGSDDAPVADGDALTTPVVAPQDLALHPGGGLVFNDRLHHCIRWSTLDGALRTLAGRCGEKGFEGDGGPSEDALLSGPFGLAFAPDGALWIADTDNQVVRRVAP
jgi:hypothetical protein